MKLKDRNETVLKGSAVTSVYKDRHVVSAQGQGSSSPALKLTVGSCPLYIIYDKIEDRDADYNEIANFL